MWLLRADVDDFTAVEGELQAWTEDEAHVTVSGPAEDGTVPTLYDHECRDPDCELAWTDEEEHPECPGCSGENIQTTEVPETGPAAWLNSAGIHVTSSEARVSLSVGDPRGAFTFEIRRRSDTGALLLHTPYPGESAPHMGLSPLHDGTYRVGPYNPDQRPPLYMARQLYIAARQLLDNRTPVPDTFSDYVPRYLVRQLEEALDAFNACYPDQEG